MLPASRLNVQPKRIEGNGRGKVGGPPLSVLLTESALLKKCGKKMGREPIKVSLQEKKEKKRIGQLRRKCIKMPLLKCQKGLETEMGRDATWMKRKENVPSRMPRKIKKPPANLDLGSAMGGRSEEDTKADQERFIYKGSHSSYNNVEG